MTPYIQVVTTAPDRASAEQIADRLLEERLAACVQITPCSSRYHWQGAIEQAEEMVCTVKSRRDLFAEVCRVIRSLHPYEVPEILATPMADGNAAYLDWLGRELQPAREV
ncbi:MAG: divalent-cation tolerance protein CutA [Desulfobulbus sp.]|jgi:periplasmic divalent cation tolerance protein|nr:divalent-cation tolerance protein CutA [Desulfobulbus sp.]